MTNHREGSCDNCKTQPETPQEEAATEVWLKLEEARAIKNWEEVLLQADVLISLNEKIELQDWEKEEIKSKIHQMMQEGISPESLDKLSKIAEKLGIKVIEIVP